MAKHQHLISKYHWKSRENFIKLSADSAFSFLGIGSKTKTRNWRKVFYNMFYRKLDITNLKQRSSKVEYTCLLHSLARICFYFERRSNYSYISFFKKFLKILAKLKWKKCEKSFYCMLKLFKHQYSVNKYHWKSRQKFYKTFRGFRVFVLRYRVKNENAELVESVLQHVLL